ncbi:MAG TPA: ATP synthase subunit I [Acidiferrobacterales bacterium]|nr:ATP synthase subunit I [Acidiferrobacterales bacterium]
MVGLANSNAQRVVALQVLVSIVLALILLLGSGGDAAIAALIGGAIGFVPASIYAWRMTAARVDDPKALLGAQYRAEFYKFAVTAVLFALTFLYFRDVAALFLFLGYLATLLVYWVALAMF